MHPRTQATIAELEQADWFSAVGVRDTSVAVVLSSWQEAVTHCGALEWQNLCLEARNQYSERLFELSRERFSQWNDIVIPLKAVTIPLVIRKTADVCARHQLPKVFVDTVQWDILQSAWRRSTPMSIRPDFIQPGLLVRQGTLSLRLGRRISKGQADHILSAMTHGRL